MAELKCKKCGDILNDDNCDELYHLHINNIDVDNSTELMCNDCAFREDARKHVQEFICDDESLKLDERMFISFKRVMEKYKIEEKWRDYLNEVFRVAKIRQIISATTRGLTALKILFVTVTKQAMQTISLITLQTTIMARIGNLERNLKIGIIHTLAVIGLRALKMIMIKKKGIVSNQGKQIHSFGH